MELFGEQLAFSAGFFLLLALALALAFEFVNGFHDTANAVATVIYTNTLKPIIAVIWSGMWNLFGALGLVGVIYGIFGFATISGAVAYNIVALLPPELVLNTGSGAGFAMIFALLLSAILWNVGTWYMGLPASSSHTLIGSIMGVGVADSIIAGHGWIGGINWDQAYTVGLALALSPVVGFLGAGLLLLILKVCVPRKDLFSAPPDKTTPPPFWIRCLLVLTCTLVSLFHGSNDAQKGMGLIMLILVGIVPGAFARELGHRTRPSIQNTKAELVQVVGIITPMAKGTTLPEDQASGELTAYLKPSAGKATEKTFAAVATLSQSVITNLGTTTNFNSLPRETRIAVRTDMYLVDGALGKFGKKKAIADPAQAKAAGKAQGRHGQDHQVHPDLGEVRGRVRARLRHNGRLEADRGDGGREDRQVAPDLRAGRLGRVDGGGDDRPGRRPRPAGEHDPRAVLRHRGHHGGEPLGPADADADQHRAGLGADPAGLRVPRRDAVLGRALRDLPRVWDAVAMIRPYRPDSVVAVARRATAIGCAAAAGLRSPRPAWGSACGRSA